jgi:transposase
VALLVHIKAIFNEVKGAYGWPRIWQELQERGVRAGKERVRKLMKAHSLCARGKRKFKATTNSAHKLPVSPNLLERKFSVEAPDCVWIGDITYLWTDEGWLYLAVVIDLFYRQITMLGHECVVVAPSLVPTRPGDHVKTDRRDAVTQASLFRSGELTPVWVPDDAHEAMRDLCRTRQAAMEALRRARQQVLGFLLRHGRVYSGGGHWTRKHRLWLSAQRFDHPARQIAFEELVQAVEEAQARRDRLAKQMLELLPSCSLAKVVTAIQALRGVASIVAITLVAEIGEFHRFANPRQLMAYLGLTPSERSSGAKTLRGAITKAGNTRARRVLIEGGWTYRLPARIGAQILNRNETLPQPIKDIAWKAQVRLCARHRRLARAGKPEPPRVCRRPFGLSHAAMAGASSCA